MQAYDFHIYERRRKNNKPKIFLLLLIVIIGTFLVTKLFHVPKETSPRPIVSGLSVLAEQVGIKQNELEPIVQESLKGAEGSYAVYIKNLTTQQTYTLNEHQQFDSGSLYKLWVMAVTLDQIHKGRLKDDQVIEQEVAILNKKFHIASESAELTEGNISFTIASALKQMITISHNYAALILTEKVGLSNVKRFLVTNGFHESQVGGPGALPKTTAWDMGVFFEKLLNTQLADEFDSARMISLLKEQRLNNKLPKYLPEEIVVAHKTGELGSFSHDAGIVYGVSGKYIIVVLSKTKYPSVAEERIAKLSKDVYDYFNQ